MRSHFETLRQAKAEFKKRTGVGYDRAVAHPSGLRIYHRKNRKLKRRYFLGTYFEWLNL